MLQCVPSVLYSTVPQYLAFCGPDNLVFIGHVTLKKSGVEKSVLSGQLLVEELRCLCYDREARISMAVIPLALQSIL